MDREPLWSRDFLLVWALTFLTFFAAFQLFPTVPLRLRDLGASLSESGRFMTLFTLGSSTGALFTGPLGDRLGHRRMLVSGAVGFGICLLLHGTFASRWGFYLLAFPHGVVWSGVLTGTMSTLGSVLPESRRADGLALYGLASPGGVIVGPMVGLWVFDHAGFPAMAWILAALFAILAAAATRLPEKAELAHEASAFHLPESNVLLPCGVLFAVALGYGALSSYSAQEARQLGFKVPSAFLSTMAAGMVGMRLVMARLGFGRQPLRLMPWMLVMALLGFSILAFGPGALSRHMLAAALYGAGYSVVFTLASTYLLEVVDPARRGAAFGSLLFAFDSGIGLGSFLLGWVIGHHSHSYRAGWALGTLCLAAALPMGLRMARHAPRPPA